MAACTLFGHRDCPASAAKTLASTLDKLVSVNGATQFYVGHQGRFERIALPELRKLRRRHPHISYHVVLPYMPSRVGSAPFFEPKESWRTGRYESR